MPSKVKQHTVKAKSVPGPKKTAVINKRAKRPSIKRKMWTEESMLCAMKAVEDGERIATAAKTYDVPRITLHDRVHGRVTHGTKLGPKPYLTREEETELSKFLVQTSDYGYGRT